MTIRALLPLALFTASLADAGTFHTTTQAAFQLDFYTEFYADVDLVLTTDYSSASLELIFDDEVTISGGPQEPSETKVKMTGTYSASFPLDPPGSGGWVYVPSVEMLSSDFEVVVSVREGEAIEIRQNGAQNHALGVGWQTIDSSGYPGALEYSAATLWYGGTYGGLLTEWRGPPGSPSLEIWGASLVDLSLDEFLPGDFNDDGIVDAADYTLYRDGVGALAPYLMSHEAYALNYGRVAPSAATVPEASAAALAALAVLLSCGGWLGTKPKT